MKHITKIITIVLFLIIPFSKGVVSQSKVKLDIKTQTSEKSDLMAAKIGTSYYLLQSEWATVTEIGEDYSVWLKNYKRSIDGEKITVAMDIEIRTPAMFRSGSLLASDKISVSFKTENDWEDVKSLSQALEKEIKTMTKEIQVEAVVTGKAACESVRNILKDIGKKK